MKTIAGFLLLALAGSAAAAETFSASAESKNAGGSVLKAPVTISPRASRPCRARRDRGRAESGGHEAARKVLLGMKDIGDRDRQEDGQVKYAFARPMGSGRLPDRRRRGAAGGAQVGLRGCSPSPATTSRSPSSSSTRTARGTARSPAAKIKLREDGALTTEDALHRDDLASGHREEVAAHHPGAASSS